MLRAFFAKKTISDISYLTLRISGMRLTEEFEIAASGREDGAAVISRYEIIYGGGAEERRLSAAAGLPLPDVISMLNECRVLEWDGFFGPHPRTVTDGEMFVMEASVNGGRRITASGSQNFPKGFYDLRRRLGEAAGSGQTD